jgi:hypothetical protein
LRKGCCCTSLSNLVQHSSIPEFLWGQSIRHDDATGFD